MRIKVLMIGDDPVSLLADIQLLRDHNIMVYTCFNTDNAVALADEIAPDVIFVNPFKADIRITDVYNKLLSDIHLAHVPVIYTLSEDDVYLVTRKRTSSKNKRSIIADNIIDAVKSGLHTERSHVKISHGVHNNNVHLPIYTARA